MSNFDHTSLPMLLPFPPLTSIEVIEDSTGIEVTSICLFSCR